MYYCALSLGVLEHTLQISCHLCNLVCLKYIFRELSLKADQLHSLKKTAFSLKKSYFMNK